MLIETVVYDRVAAKPIWHSIETTRAAMKGLSYDVKEANRIGPLHVAITLNAIIERKTVQQAEEQGMRRTTALEPSNVPGQAGTALNKKANLIFFNRMPQETVDSEKFDSGRKFYDIQSSHLQGRAKKTSYYNDSKTHVALELPPGTYEIAFYKDRKTFDIKENGPPVYLSFDNGIFSTISINELSPQKALELTQDSLNALLPELTPSAPIPCARASCNGHSPKRARQTWPVLRRKVGHQFFLYPHRQSVFAHSPDSFYTDHINYFKFKIVMCRPHAAIPSAQRAPYRARPLYSRYLKHPFGDSHVRDHGKRLRSVR